MIHRVDDPLYQVNSEFIGPPGYTFPFRARYSAYGIGVVLAVLLLIAESLVGIHAGLFVVIWSLLAVVGGTRFLGRYLDFERPLRTIPLIFWHELTSPRYDRKVQHDTFTPRQVKVMP